MIITKIQTVVVYHYQINYSEKKKSPYLAFFSSVINGPED